MNREELELQSWRFTRISALVREIEALLECTDYKFVVTVRADQMEELASEIENWHTLGRVEVKQITEAA